MPQMFGKYRGIATNNIDPMNLGRVEVMVPVLGADAPLGWALPCVPFAGRDVGLCLIPPVGANVWVEFEGGDTGFPIWSGCFWGSGEYPAEAMVSPRDQVQVLKGYGFKLVANSVGPTGLTIEVSPPMLGRTLRLVMNDEGIHISNQDDVTVKLTPDRVEVEAQRQGKIHVSADSIEISNPMSSIKMGGGNLDLKTAAASVKMTNATVNVNDGALEVI